MTLLRAARALWLAATLGIAFGSAGSATAQVAVPPLTARVTDQTATLDATQKAALEQTLQAFEAKKGSQIAVLMVPTTAPETIEQYSLRVAEQWKLGRKKVDDGAILVIAKNDRALRIEVGYGLEGPLNDATAKRIISETITPRFKAGDFNGGITAGVEQMMRVINGEPLPPPSARAPVRGSGASGGIEEYLPVLFVLALVVGGVLRAALGRLPGAAVTGGIVGLIAWFLVGTLFIASAAGVIALIFTLMGGSSMLRGIGGLSGGFGGGHSSGGGGFGGGGGGFGGGGASGRW